MSSQHVANKQVLPDDIDLVPPSVNCFFPAITGVAAWMWVPAQDRAAYAEEWRELLGLPTDQPLGLNIAWLCDRIAAEDREAFRDACRACSDGQTKELDIAVRLDRVSALPRWVLLRGTVVDAAEQGLRISGVAVDVSRLRLDGRFLPMPAENGQAYQAMAENSPDFIIRFDRRVFPLYINPVAAAYLDVTPGQQTESAWGALGIRPMGRAFFRRHVTTVFETTKGLRTTASLPSKRGRQVTGEFCFWPELDAAGEVVAVTCHMSDISEQVQAEQEVRQNEQRFSAMYQLAQMLDRPEDEIIRFVVEQIALLTKSPYSYIYLPDFGEHGKNQMVWSQSVLDLVGADKLPTDRIPQDCFTREFDCETTAKTPFINNCSDGHGPYVAFECLIIRRYMLVPFIEDGRVVCIASVCNKENEYSAGDLRQLELFIHGSWLTLRRRRYVGALRKAKESAERASRVKDEFLANISHELRTPLNGMLSMLQLLELAPLADEHLKYVRAASLSGQSLLRIISDILDFSRMKSGKMSLQASPFDLRGTLTSTMNLFAGEARQRGLALSVSIDDALPPLLVGDDARVRQILFNLVGNALKFTEQGGISAECSLLPHRAKGKLWIYIAIADTGAGIPPEAHSTIFDSFTQLEGKTGKYAGTGLGLSIVKQLVLHMGGSLTVESQVGEGTTIHCSLPFEMPATSSVPSLQPSREEPLFRRLDILVAEDDPIGRFAIRTFLNHIGHRVLCVNAGRQALEALQIYPFDCLITDIQMPDMDGLEVVRRIRQGNFADIRTSDEVTALVRRVMPEARLEQGSIPHDLTVVAFTAHAMRGDRERFLRMGMDLYLSKPIIMEELQKILQQVLQRVNVCRKGA